MDYGRPLEFGISVVPNAAEVVEVRALVRRADELGLDLVGVQDHPYQWRFLDTWLLLATLLADTQRIRVFPDVANLPLRGPAMIAKQAASLDVASGGRFELGLGAGWAWDAIAAMGGPRRTPGEALEALEEAIAIIRLYWSGERSIAYEGRHYSVKGLHPGPAPVHPIEIWLGVTRPRGSALAGRAADGWVVSVGYVPPEKVPELAARIDESAAAAGREPSEIRRAYNVPGPIDDTAAWAETLADFVLDLGFDTLVFWPEGHDRAQVELFAQEIAPAVRERVGAARK